MRHFNAIIQVNEDAEFRKTVIDAIKGETNKQLEGYLRQMLPAIVAEILREPKFTGLILDSIKDSVKTGVDHYLSLAPEMKVILDEQKEIAKKWFENYLTPEVMQGIVAKCANEFVARKFGV